MLDRAAREADLSASIVIIGAGHAGGTAAALLRQYGHKGSIALLGEEGVAPYQRPPLSKAWLKGSADADSLALRGSGFYADAGIGLRSGIRVERIDRKAKSIALHDGETLAYDRLILATGARPIRLPMPGADLSGVLVLRSAADAEALKNALGAGRRIAIVGGGYIGLEVAASAVSLGGSAVVIEREPRLLARSGSEAIATFFDEYHRAKGVDIVLGASVAGFEGRDGQISGVRLADGTVTACDVALLGIGVVPNQELAEQAGLDCRQGIVVNAEARTSDPCIFAIGDVTRRPLAHYGCEFRLESVPNALEQAKQAASALCGRSAPPAEVPWNWSDQYDIKLQVAGMAFDIDRTVIRGDVAARKFAAFHLCDGRVRQVEAINAPAEFMAGKLLIASGQKIDIAKLRDTTVSMKDMTLRA